MAKQYVYLGESNGARLIRLGGAALQQITTGGLIDVLLDVGTWPFVPLGQAGDSVFRMLLATVRYTNGFSIRITPTVDGVDLPSQDFGLAGAATFCCEAPIVSRGAQVSARVQQLSRTGDLELIDVAVAYAPIRLVP